MIDLAKIEDQIHSELMNQPDYFEICTALTQAVESSGQSFLSSAGTWQGLGMLLEFGHGFNRKFFINRDGVDEYTPAQLAMPGELECTYLIGDAVSSLGEQLELSPLVVMLNQQEPGHVVGTHSDHFRSLTRTAAAAGIELRPKHIRRFAVFLEDQAIGHSFMVGTESMRWRAGDIVEFPWYALHATANAGLVPKRLITVAGVRK